MAAVSEFSAPDRSPFVEAGGLVVMAWRRAWLAVVIEAALLAAWLSIPAAGGGLRALGAAAGGLVLAGALWRLSLRLNGLGPAGVQFGVVEARLAAVGGLTLVFLGILGALAFVLILACAYAAAASGHGFAADDVRTWPGAVDGRGRALVTVVALACAAGLAWSWARIGLAAPVSLARGRVQVLASWPVSRGRVGKVLAVGALAVGLLLGLGVAVATLREAGLSLVAGGLAGLVLAGGWAPLIVGLLTDVYRRSAAGAPGAAP